MEEGRPEEEDLFIYRACLQTLAVATGESTERQLRGCEDLLIAMGMIRGGLPLPDTPLMHFTSFFIQASAPPCRDRPTQQPSLGSELLAGF